jgi:hypothetical protein
MTSRDDVFKVTFGKLDAPLTRLSDTNNGYYAVSDDVTTIDKLLTDKATTELRKINLQPIIPPDVRAKRSIFIRQIDRSVGTRHADDIKEELEKQQPWLKINEIIKIKDYTHVIKMICNSTTIANRVLTDGLKAFNTRITPNQCEQERFTHLLICYKCYDYDKHPTKDCPQTFDICSECATTGHTFRDCKSTNKSCINCKSDSHRTLAANCPYRKNAIRDKETKIKDDSDRRQNKTYADIAKKAIQETIPAPTPIINITSKTHLKLTALIIEAHIASLTDGKSYGRILSQSLKDNFDIDAKFPDRDSQKIFNIYVNRTDDENEDKMDDDDRHDYYMDDDHRRSSLNISGNLELQGPSVRPKEKIVTRTEPTSPDRFAKPKNKTHIDRRDRSRDNKRKATTEPDLSETWPQQLLDNQLGSIEAEAVGLKFFKSTLDRNKIPDKIDNDYFIHEIKQQTDFGLKLTATKGDSNFILGLITDRTVKLTRLDITLIHHDQFKKLPRVNIVKPHKKTKQLTPPT